MATIYSSDLKLSIMATGENAGTWGQITNTNLYLIQQAIGGYQAISIAGGAQTTALAMSDGAISNARNAVIKLTGTITGNQVVTIPDGIEKTWLIYNETVGAFTVQFKTVSGTGPTFSTTDKGIKYLYADGTNVIDINSNLSTIELVNQNQVRFEDATGGEYVALRAPSTVSASYIITFPGAVASAANYALTTTDSSGTLQWVATSTFGITTGKAIAMAIVFGS
jgi:hypothetical protein